jgi:SNF2 family DNA or RNA helicase
MNRPEKIEPDIITYDWPCEGITPDINQMLTTTFMVNNHEGCVFNDPGTGKTLSALWACDFIMGYYKRGKVKALILAPLSTLDSVWAKEIKTHLFGRRNCAIVHGSQEKRARQLEKNVDFYIMNYDGIKVFNVYNILRNRPDIKLVVIDESTAFSDDRTMRHKSACDILHPRPYVWLMTGTPLIRGHMAAHGQARLVHPGYWERRGAFQGRTTVKRGSFKREPTSDAYHKAMELLQPAIRIPRRAFHSIPPAVPVPYEIPLTREQSLLYEALKKDFKAALASGAKIDAAHEGVLRWKLLQISCGAIYDGERNAHNLDASPRVAQLHQSIDEAEGKALVFAPFTAALKRAYDLTKSKFKCAIVTGETSLKARSQIFKSFEETNDIEVIFADPGTMAHGLTLVKASVIIWFGPTDKAELYVQANQRIDRPGQTKNTYIVQLMSTAVEREIYSRLQNNIKMEGAMLKMLEADE